MPLDIPTGFAQASVQLKHTDVVRPASITFGIGDGVGAIASDAADKVQDAFADTMVAQFDTGVRLGPTTLRIGPGPEYLAQVSSIANVNGSASGSAPPPNVAVLCHKRTARGGRRGRGRLYLPWACSEGDVDEAGVWGSLSPATLLTRLTAFLARLNTDGVPMCVLHNDDSGEPGPPDAVTSFTVDTLVATQRRRLRG